MGHVNCSRNTTGLARRVTRGHTPRSEANVDPKHDDDVVCGLGKDRDAQQRKPRGKMQLGETAIGKTGDVGKHEACYAVPSSKSLLMAAAMRRFVRNHHGQAENVGHIEKCKDQVAGGAEHDCQEHSWTREESQKEAGPREMMLAPTAGDRSCLLEFFLSMQKSVEAIETNLDLGRKMQQGYLDESFLALLDIVEGLGTNTQLHASKGDTVGVWQTLDQQAERLQRRCSEHYFARWNSHAGSASI